MAPVASRGEWLTNRRGLCVLQYTSNWVPLRKGDLVSAATVAPEMAQVPTMLAPRSFHGLTVHFDAAALAEYEAHSARCDEIFAIAAAAHGPMLRQFGQPCPILLHGLGGSWKYGHELKRRDHGFDLGDATTGICFYGNFHYEAHADVDQAIIVINVPAALLDGTSQTKLASQLSHAFCEAMVQRAAPAPIAPSAPAQPVAGPSSSTDPSTQPAPPLPPPASSNPRTNPQAAVTEAARNREPRLVPADFAVPSYMSAWCLGALAITLDDAALAEYYAEFEAYDEIFERSDTALRPLLRSLGQCPIWVHGLHGCWTYGHELKRREHGVDLGDADRGLAWHGNMHYDDAAHPEQSESVFLINLPSAVLAHPMVLIHELTHHFHLTVGPEKLPMITKAYQHTKRLKQLILARFDVTNRGQFEYTLTNELEFLAYMMEAYHSTDLHAPMQDASVRREAFAAPAFPTTRDELATLDAEFNVGITSAIEEVTSAMIAHAAARVTPPTLPTPTPRTASAEVIRQRFEAMLVANPGMEPNAAAALVLQDLLPGDAEGGGGSSGTVELG